MDETVDRIEQARKSRRWRYDNDLRCLVEITDGTNTGPERVSGPNVMRDIDPYVAVGMKDPHTGNPVIVGGRKQHRDELRARNLTEVGNETSGWGDRPQMPSAAPALREAAERMGLFSGARTLRELRRQGRL